MVVTEARVPCAQFLRACLSAFLLPFNSCILMIVLGPSRGMVSFYAPRQSLSFPSGPGILPVHAKPYSLAVSSSCCVFATTQDSILCCSGIRDQARGCLPSQPRPTRFPLCQMLGQLAASLSLWFSSITASAHC